MAESLKDRVLGVVTAPVQACGVDLEDVDVQAAGKRRLVRVLVDTESGVSMDEVAAVTTAISAALDETDVMGERAYTLEVGSPGVDRPLTQPRHWRRNVDRLVRVSLDPEEPYVARIAGTTDTGAVLTMPDGSEREVAYSQVRRAVVQVELNRRGSE